MILPRIDATGSRSRGGRFKRGPVAVKFNICGQRGLCLRGANEFAAAAAAAVSSARFSRYFTVLRIIRVNTSAVS